MTTPNEPTPPQAHTCYCLEGYDRNLHGRDGATDEYEAIANAKPTPLTEAIAAHWIGCPEDETCRCRITVTRPATPPAGADLRAALRLTAQVAHRLAGRGMKDLPESFMDCTADTCTEARAALASQPAERGEG